eukprot:Awhi_evm1s10927
MVIIMSFIFSPPSNFFSDVSDSTNINSGVDVSVPVVVGVNSEVVVVSSDSVALTKLQTKKNLVNCHRRKLAQITEVTSQTFDSHPPKSLFDAFLSDLFLMCDNAM